MLHYERSFQLNPMTYLHVHKNFNRFHPRNFDEGILYFPRICVFCLNKNKNVLESNSKKFFKLNVQIYPNLIQITQHDPGGILFRLLFLVIVVMRLRKSHCNKKNKPNTECRKRVNFRGRKKYGIEFSTEMMLNIYTGT